MSDFEDRDTWDQRPRFKLRRFPDGNFHLPIDALDDPILPILSAGFLSLELKDGTTKDQAMALLDLLEEHVAYVLYTGKPAPKWDDIPGRRERFGQTEDQHSVQD